jgi:hypothetical protein
MRIRTFLIIVLTLPAAAAFADCKPNLEARATSKITIGNITPDCNFGEPQRGDAVSIKASDATIAATVVKYYGPKQAGSLTLPATLEIASTDPAPEKLLLINNEATVSVGVNGQKADAKVLSLSPNYTRYAWSLGPATSGDADGKGTATASSSGAIRVKYDGEFAKPTGSLRTTGTLNIDTTDQSSTSFIDNNRASFGVRWDVAPADFLKQTSIGIDTRFSKAVHHDIHDVDVALTVAGWLPMIPNLNVLNQGGEFISTPLSLTASYGYRNRNEGADNFHGRIFEGTALYHLFALDRYKVDVHATWTVNDLTNRPATTPHTQRLYNTTISYLADPSKGFSVLTSFESGSAGVMVTKVRQYFVGLALSKLSFPSK